MGFKSNTFVRLILYPCRNEVTKLQIGHVLDGSLCVEASFEFLSSPILLQVLMFSLCLLNLFVVNVF
jgi:hypothetical protein